MTSPYPPYAPYAAEHAAMDGPDDARPSAIKIIEDENLVNGLVGHVALVTGCTSGIGPETARALYATGMTVYMTVRTLSKGAPILTSIKSSLPNSSGSLHLLEMDLGSLDSVRAAAAKFLAEQSHLSILVCNAGVMACPWGLTADGFETQFGTNHLAHFLLLQLLLPALEAGSSTQRHARVVMVSSSGHKNCPPRNTGDYDFAGGKAYDPWAGYGQSKTANVWTANQLERLYGTSKGIHGFSLHPGGIWTPLQKHVSKEKLAEWQKIPGVEKLIKSSAQGAATSVWAATAKYWEGKGGVYLEDCSVALPGEEVPKGGSLAGFAEWAYQKEGEERLWRDSLVLVGIVGEGGKGEL